MGMDRWFRLLQRIGIPSGLATGLLRKLLQTPITPLDFVPGRILHVCGSLGPGGAERQLTNTVVGLINNGYTDIHVSCAYLRPDRPEQYDFYRSTIEAAGAHVQQLQPFRQSLADWFDRNVAERGWPWLLLDIRLMIGVAAYYRTFRTLRPEVVHAWLDYSNIRAGIAAVLAGVPTVILSGRNLNPTRFNFYSPIMYAVYSALAQFINISSDMPTPCCAPEPQPVTSRTRVIMVNNSRAGATDYARWLGWNDSCFSVVYNGVNFGDASWPSRASAEALRSRYDIPRDAPLVGSVFRFYPEKDPLLWLHTAAEILRRVPNCHFLLFGNGTLRRQLVSLAIRLGIAGRLHMPGVTTDVLTALSAMDVMLFTPHYEGTPNVVLEAGWVGTPVVTTEAGGVCEALAQGHTGFVVAERDPVALADRVCSVLNDDGLRLTVLTAGPDFVRRHYGLDRMIAETIALYWSSSRNRHVGEAAVAGAVRASDPNFLN